MTDSAITFPGDFVNIFTSNKKYRAAGFSGIDKASTKLVKLISFLAATCVDATQEELFHAITQYGYANAYKKILGELPPTLNSKIQLAMDKARYEWVLERLKRVTKTLKFLI